MPSFDRGFKSWAEKCSLSLRKDLGVKGEDPLCPWKLAEYLNVNVYTPEDIVGLSDEYKNQLLVEDSDGWSAVTVTYQNIHTLIHNPQHAPTRQASNIMHELSHLIAGHDPAKIILSLDGSMVMRSFDQKQEDEATWLGGCLLLPRKALLHIKQIKMTKQSVSQTYGVSPALYQYRLNVTGVGKQAKTWSKVGSK